MADFACKICGLTRPEDVDLCHDLKVDITGFIFVTGSPRAVSPPVAAAMPRGVALRAGVFAGMDVSGIKAVARQAKLDLIQLHGGEDEAFCRSLGPERIIKVLWPERLNPGELHRELERFAPVCACFLLDAGTSGGGSGKRLALSGLAGIVPPRPWFLAGGLGPVNLEPSLAALADFICAPIGLDLNSGLESSPGVKNHDLVREALFILSTCCGHRPPTLEKRA